MNSEATDRNARTVALLFTIILIVPAVFYQTLMDMARVWQVNETFTHGFLVFPLTLWLIWDKREQLARMKPAPEPLFLFALPIFLGLWLVSAIIDVKVVMELSMISLILTLVLAILGRTIFLYLAFPLLFLYLAVPMGQALIPILMDFTANNTVHMIRLTGIPVYQDGFNFILPSGNWSVVEECSGVRYLIATVTLGVVYSYVTYASLKKRLIFTLLTFIVPILANSLRAYMIVMLGHFSGMRIAVGADHILYGWVLFGIIIFILFYVGNIWRDSREEFDRSAPVSEGNTKTGRTMTYLASSVVVIVCVLVFYQSRMTVPEHISTKASINIANTLGHWHVSHDSKLPWKPKLHQPDLQYSKVYLDDSSTNPLPVQLDIGYYLVQRNGHETVSTQNRQVSPYGSNWKITQSRSIHLGKHKVQQIAILHTNYKLLTWKWYRIGNYQTRSQYKAKLYEAYLRIFNNRSDGAYISIATPISGSIKTAQARLADFFEASNARINEDIETVHNSFINMN